MKRTFRLGLFPAALTLAMAGPVCAQTSTTTSTTTQATSTAGSTNAAAKDRSDVARSDVSNMKKAAKSGMAEVESSKLALDKATSEKVKSFAQKMVDDHTKVNEELKQLASAKGVELPTEPSAAQKAKMKMLTAAKGADFDKRYVETMGVKAHEDAVNLFQGATKESRDAEVKAFFAAHVPALAAHLKMAKELNAATSKSAAKK